MPSTIATTVKPVRKSNVVVTIGWRLHVWCYCIRRAGCVSETPSFTKMTVVAEARRDRRSYHRFTNGWVAARIWMKTIEQFANGRRRAMIIGRRIVDLRGKARAPVPANCTESMPGRGLHQLN